MSSEGDFIWISHDQLSSERRSTIKHLIRHYKGLNDLFVLDDLRFMVTKTNGATRVRHAPSGIETVGISTKEAMNYMLTRLAVWFNEGIRSYPYLVIKELLKKITDLEGRLSCLEPGNK